MKNNLFKLIIISGICFGFAACSIGHKNPLTVINPHDSSHFLVDASHYAENKMKRENLNNYGYRDCMDEKLDKKTCQTLFNSMLSYAKTKPLFKSLTYADLTDFAVWQHLKSRYISYAFTFFS